MIDDQALHDWGPAEVTLGPNIQFIPDEATGVYNEEIVKNRLGKSYLQESERYAEKYRAFEQRVVLHQAILNVSTQVALEDEALAKAMVSESKRRLSQDFYSLQHEREKLSGTMNKYRKIVANEESH